MAPTPRVVRDPTLLDVFAAFIAHALVAQDMWPDDHLAKMSFDFAEELLAESEKRHGHRPE